MLPHRSATVRCEVDRPSWSGAATVAVRDVVAVRVVAAVRRPGRHRLDGGRGLVQAAEPLVGERLREQLSEDARLHRPRVPDVGAAVGVRERARLEVVVQGPVRVGPEHGTEVDPLEDVQRLADGRPAARGRRHAPDPHAPVAHARRLAADRAVPREVSGCEQAGTDVPGRGRVLRWRPDGADDLAAEPAGVQPPDALAPQPVVGAGQRRVAEDRPHGRRLTAGEEQPAGRQDVGEPRGVRGGLVVEGLVDDEAATGHRGGRRERARERAGAPAAQRRDPGRRGAGHAHRQAAVDRLVEGEAAVGVGSGGARRGLPAVDGPDLLRLGVVEHEEATAADAGGVGLGDPQRGGGGHRRIDRVAAAPQHPQPDPGRLRVDAGHRSPAPDRGRLLAGRPVRGVRGMRGGAAAEQRGRHDERGGGGQQRAPGGHGHADTSGGRSRTAAAYPRMSVRNRTSRPRSTPPVPAAPGRRRPASGPAGRGGTTTPAAGRTAGWRGPCRRAPRAR